MVQNTTDALQEIPDHLCAITINDTSGQLALVASNLTGRDWNGTIALFDDPKFAPNIPHIDFSVKVEYGCTSVAWINETRLVTSTDSGSLLVFDLKDRPTLENSIHLSEHGDICSSVSVSKHTKQLISGGWDCLIKLWDLEVDMSVNTFSMHSEKVLEVKYDTHEINIFGSVSEDQTVAIYDNRKSEKPGLIAAKTKIYYPTCLEWIDSNKVAVGLSNGAIVVYDLRNPNLEVTRCQSHQNYVTRLVVADNYIYSSGEDCKVYSHDINTLKETYKDGRHTDYVTDICVNSKDKSVWSCGWDSKIYSHCVAKTENMEI